MPFDQHFDWLAARYYIQFEISPVSDTRVQIFDIDKYGNPRVDSMREYQGETLEAAMTVAHEAETLKKINSVQDIQV